MDLFAVIAHHGYAVTAAIVFIACCGLPLPLSVLLLTAGAEAHHGSLNLALIILTASAASLSGDTLMYLGGRATGWWLLAGLCRVSMNPDQCIFGSARSFYKRGPRTLLFSKYVPGLATVAAPLAGSLNMKLPRFLLLDGCGVLIYMSSWILTGFVFAPVLRDIIRWVQSIGHITAVAFAVLVVAYVAWLLLNSLRESRFSKVEMVAAAELFERLRTATHDRLVIIADVRSHGYYDPGMQRIKNSIRVEPSRLKEELVALREFMQPECEIYLYCSCAREATSVRVARLLAEEDCNTKVIRGGMKAWIKAGGPLEAVPLSDLEHLPRFD
jgi:membrane protein DedA with SNARE-associated domain/rhodanese-related sulfurtransferase